MKTKPKTPAFKKCQCGNWIVLAHGQDECAVCYMKKRGLWSDPIEELRKRFKKLKSKK